jgi:hypothetical protein
LSEIPFVLCGSKQEVDAREVEHRKAATWAMDLGGSYTETSAYNGFNCAHVFPDLVDLIKRQALPKPAAQEPERETKTSFGAKMRRLFGGK